MADLKLTDDDFKGIDSRTGVKYYNINEEWVKHILNDQEIVERLKLAIDKYDGQMNENDIAKILKEILGNIE